MKNAEPFINENARKILEARYLIKNDEGKTIETPGQLFTRVAKAVASAEKDDGDRKAAENTFTEMLMALDFLPNTPCLVNAGRPGGTGQLSACFVLPVPDSMEGIFEAVKQMALVHKSGGGTGFSFSRLRQKGARVKTTSGIASGPLSFMIPFNATTETTKQGGVRRGANMGVLRVDHPDILDFIRLKANDVNAMQNFNVSVGITDVFMEALAGDMSYDLIDPASKKIVNVLKARDVWNEIVQCAHKIGDPGLFFIDRANALDPLTEVLGEIEATNPCGEVPLRAHDACTLGSINLANFFAEDTGIDWTRLAMTVQIATRFLDNVLSVNKYPVPEIHKVTEASRKIGLGVMGWAELLIKAGIAYADDAAVDLARQVMSFISKNAIEMSERLAKTRGEFPTFEKSKHKAKNKRRNSTCTVIAPTGTISIIAGCSSGIEPLFALGMTREQAGMKLLEVNPLLEQIARREGFWSEELQAHVARTGSVQNAPGVPYKWQRVLMVANEIPVKSHIDHQAAFQMYTEDGVSKTINMAREATLEDVNNAYMQAWTQGCKGITVYRDGSRDGQVLTAGTVKTEAVPAPVVMQSSMPAYVRRRIPDDGRRKGETFTRPTSFGSVHVSINEHPADSEPFEVFVRIGKGGSEINAWTEAFGRSTSYLLSLPSPISPSERLMALADQLEGIGGGEAYGRGDERVSSAADAIAKIIKKYLDAKKATPVDVPPAVRFDLCPRCGQATFTKEIKCGLCRNCGHTQCS